jgi:hypothetical protein
MKLMLRYVKLCYSLCDAIADMRDAGTMLCDAYLPPQAWEIVEEILIEPNESHVSQLLLGSLQNLFLANCAVRFSCVIAQLPRHTTT